MHGYQSKILRVNLNRGEMWDEPLPESWARLLIGGSGLAARYLYGLVDAHTDPLGPDNPLIFMAGPLTGTAAPACGRHVVCARSPATGLWGEANSGGRFGAQMRLAGYDGIIIEGQAPQPTYLSVMDGQPRLRKATHLWGLDSYQMQEAVKDELGDEKISVACIGLGGENRVKMAAVMNDEGRAAGRGGLGAVMGAKNLKAVAVRGTQAIPLADEATFKVALHRSLVTLKNDFSVQLLRELGTPGGVEYLQMLGDMPNRYFTQGQFEGSDKLSGSAMAETIITGNGTCHRCPIACWRMTEVAQGPYQQKDIDGPEYETVAAFGSLILTDDLEAVAYAGHLCNLYGLDTISAGSTIAFAYHLYDQGIIDEIETGGLRLAWGDPAPIIKLIEMMARRQGFGDVLAEGSREMERRYGVEGQAAQVNGLEVAMHDPRAFPSMALVYATSPRGACHNQGDMYYVEMGRGVPELGIEPADDGGELHRFEMTGRAQSVARSQDYRSFYNALIMCIFCNPPPQDVTDMLAAVTGWEVDLEDLLTTGERIWNLKRVLNNRLGLNRSNDRLPKALLEPLPDGGAAGHRLDLDLMLREYYAVRSWDWETGQPTREKLMSLGLDDLKELA